jgi:hypothetical protein
MTDYIVCIPSYKRSLKCQKQSLSTLARHNINPEKIFVYVADEEEYEIYKTTLDKSLYNELRIGKKGLVFQRQFISRQFPTGQHLVYLDDDIEEVDLSLTAYPDLDHFFQDAFQECIKQKAYIWGVYPVLNPFFRKTKKDITTHLNFIIGAFYGIINRPTTQAIELTLTEEQAGKEDVERSLKYFILDGIVLRFNKVGIKTKYYGTDGGGLGKFKDRLKPMADACVKLAEHYGAYGKVKVRKNGMSEFVFNRQPRVVKHK